VKSELFLIELPTKLQEDQLFINLLFIFVQFPAPATFPCCRV